MIRIVTRTICCATCPLASLLFVITAYADQSATFPIAVEIVSQRERNDAKVSFRLPSGIQGPLRVVETSDGGSVPRISQLDADEQRLWWIAEGKLEPGTRRTFRLEQGDGPRTSDVIVDAQPHYVEVRCDSHKLLRYNSAHVEPPSGVDPAYGRSAHIHPVWTLNGSVVTDEFPPDHLHQSGVFFAYTRSEFEGHKVDFWNLLGGQGRVRFRKLLATQSGPIFGRIRTEHEHVDLTVPNGKVALVETWELKVWNPQARKLASSRTWAFDIKSTSRCASSSPLQLPEHHYGGMALRGARSWKVNEVQIVTNSEHDRIAGNHTRSNWCYMGGTVEGKLAGLSFMTHPGNFRFPEPLRIHPTMPYMVYTPSFLGDWSIEPGRPHTLNYRLAIHDGEFSAAESQKFWLDFADSIEATQAKM